MLPDKDSAPHAEVVDGFDAQEADERKDVSDAVDNRCPGKIVARLCFQIANRLCTVDLGRGGSSRRFSMSFF